MPAEYEDRLMEMTTVLSLQELETVEDPRIIGRGETPAIKMRAGMMAHLGRTETLARLRDVTAQA